MSETSDAVATRVAYDTVARDYAELLRDDLRANPFDRAVLGVFAEQVAALGGGPVADLGCGPGRIAGHLAGLGLYVSGLDLSPGMVEVARRDHPGVAFSVGSMLDLPHATDALAGALAWYSIIHIPKPEQGRLFAEFARVVRPGGLLLLAFQVSESGDEEVVHPDAGVRARARPADAPAVAGAGARTVAGGGVRARRGAGSRARGAGEDAAGLPAVASRLIYIVELYKMGTCPKPPPKN